jgi:hypothetical protein
LELLASLLIIITPVEIVREPYPELRMGVFEAVGGQNEDFSPKTTLTTSIPENAEKINRGSLIRGQSLKCSCVAYVRKFTKFQFPKIKYAKDLIPIRKEPRAGGVVIFKAGGIYGKYGHLAYILNVNWNEREMFITQFNKKPCEETQEVVNIDNSEILGYYYTDF